jgi:hypothetical protein
MEESEIRKRGYFRATRQASIVSIAVPLTVDT